MRRAAIPRCALVLAVLVAMPAAAGGKADVAGKPPQVGTGEAAATSADWTTAADGKAVTVSGKVRLVGTTAFSSLVISDADGHDWYIDEADRQALAGREQKAVTVKATVEVKEMTLANGKKMEDRRILRNLSIVE